MNRTTHLAINQVANRGNETKTFEIEISPNVFRGNAGAALRICTTNGEFPSVDAPNTIG